MIKINKCFDNKIDFNNHFILSHKKINIRQINNETKENKNTYLTIKKAAF